MDSEDIVDVLIKADTLKSLNRTGWSLAGVGEGERETVAAHSYGTALAAYLIAKKIQSEGPVPNIERVLSMAIIHDLPESYISDIPGVAIEITGEEMQRIKSLAERLALEKIFHAFDCAELDITELWNELQEKKSLESRIVAAADMIDILVHALVLENRGISPVILNSFFTTTEKKIQQLELEICTLLYNALANQHQANARRLGLDI